MADEFRKLIGKRECSSAIVVFGQDVVPDTIFESTFADCLARRFLDLGGSMVWMGDIPFWYVGRQGKKAPRDLVEADGAGKYGSVMAVLGVIPLFAFPPRAVRFTVRGRGVGLKTRWAGQRPCLNVGWWGFHPLARTKSPAYISGPPMRRYRRIQLGVRAFSFGGAGIELTPKDEAKSQPRGPSLDLGHYASAWYKNFNRRLDGSGFYRIWDFRAEVLTDPMLAELAKLAEL
jgi:hypothetical protein